MLYVSNYLELADEERIAAYKRFETAFDGGFGKFRLEDYHRFADKLLLDFFCLHIFDERGRVRASKYWKDIVALRYKKADIRFPRFYLGLSYLYGADWGERYCPGGFVDEKETSPMISMFDPVVTIKDELNFDNLYKEIARTADTRRPCINEASLKNADAIIEQKKINKSLNMYTDDLGNDFTTLDLIQYSSNSIGGWETITCAALGMDPPATKHSMTATSRVERKDENNPFSHAKADLLYKGTEVECKVYWDTSENSIRSMTKKCHDTDICLCFIISLNDFQGGYRWGIRINDVFNFYTRETLPDNAPNRDLIIEMDQKLQASIAVRNFKAYKLRQLANGNVLSYAYKPYKKF